MTCKRLDTKYPNFYSAFKVTANLENFEDATNANFCSVDSAINSTKATQMNILKINIKSIRSK